YWCWIRSVFSSQSVSLSVHDDVNGFGAADLPTHRPRQPLEHVDASGNELRCQPCPGMFEQRRLVREESGRAVRSRLRLGAAFDDERDHAAEVRILERDRDDLAEEIGRAAWRESGPVQTRALE